MPVVAGDAVELPRARQYGPADCRYSQFHDDGGNFPIGSYRRRRWAAAERRLLPDGDWILRRTPNGSDDAMVTDLRLKIPAAFRCALVVMLMLLVGGEYRSAIADASSSGAKNIGAFGATGSLATVTAR